MTISPEELAGTPGRLGEQAYVRRLIAEVERLQKEIQERHADAINWYGRVIAAEERTQKTEARIAELESTLKDRDQEIDGLHAAGSDLELAALRKVAEAAESVASEPVVHDLLGCFCKGLELLSNLTAWRATIGNKAMSDLDLKAIRALEGK